MNESWFSSSKFDLKLWRTYLAPPLVLNLLIFKKKSENIVWISRLCINFLTYYQLYLKLVYGFNLNIIKISLWSYSSKPSIMDLRGVVPGGAGGAMAQWHTQILADQLTLSQRRGQIMPTTLLLAPLIFGPFYGPVFLSAMSLRSHF